MNRFWVRTGAAILAALLLGAPGQLNAQSVNSVQSKRMSTLRIGYIPVSSFLPVYVALERGFFAKKRIKAELTQIQNGSDIVSAMQGGTVDLGQTNPLSAILAKSHGINVTMVMRGIFEVRSAPATAILVAKGSPITTAKDLEGKTVAVNQLNNGTQIAAEEWMRRHGADPAKVTWTELALPQMMAPLLHGQIDAAVVGEPFTTIGKSLGARVLVYQYTALRKRTLLGGVVALRPWAAAHKSLVQRFAAAANEGEKWLDKHPAKARSYLVKYVNMTPTIASEVPLDVLGKIHRSDLSYWVRLGVRWHVLSNPINVKSLIWPTAAK